MHQLLALKNESDLILEEEGSKDSFYHLMKLIKPEFTITSFEEKNVRRYQLITDPVKVKEMLEGEKKRRINIIKVNKDEYIADNDFSEQKIQELEAQYIKRVDDASIVIDDAITNPAKYDALITSFEQDLSYPALYIRYKDNDGNKGRYTEHLREDNIPNVFAYEKKEQLKYADNHKVRNFIEQGGEFYLDTILLKKKEK